MSKPIILFGPLPPPYGGVSIFVKTLAQQLRGPNILIWTYGGAKPDEAKIRFIAHRKIGTLVALLREGRGARILDASHFHLEYPNAPLLLVWLVLKRRLRFEWFKNIHDGSLPKRYPGFGILKRWLFHRAVSAVDQFVVVSEELRRWLQEDIKVRQPVTIVSGLLPNPQSTQDTRLSSENERLLQPFGRREKRVCSIGVFYHSYGFQHVAEAVEELRERTGKDIGLLLLDGAFVRDEGYRERVLRERSWITVLEKIPNPEIYEILRRSDVFVRSFADESYGISRIEAIWCGLPVVATRAGETRGMLLYDFGNEKELVSQLYTALFNPASEDMNAWAQLYRREAEENLRAVATVLGVEGTVP